MKSRRIPDRRNKAAKLIAAAERIGWRVEHDAGKVILSPRGAWATVAIDFRNDGRNRTVRISTERGGTVRRGLRPALQAIWDDSTAQLLKPDLPHSGPKRVPLCANYDNAAGSKPAASMSPKKHESSGNDSKPKI